MKTIFTLAIALFASQFAQAATSTTCEVMTSYHSELNKTQFRDSSVDETLRMEVGSDFTIHATGHKNGSYLLMIYDGKGSMVEAFPSEGSVTVLNVPERINAEGKAVNRIDVSCDVFND